MSLAPWVLSVLTVGLAAQAHVHASEAAAAPGYYTVQATGSTGWSSMDAKVEAVRETLLAAQVPGAIVALPVKAGGSGERFAWRTHWPLFWLNVLLLGGLLAGLSCLCAEGILRVRHPHALRKRWLPSLGGSLAGIFLIVAFGVFSLSFAPSGQGGLL